MMEVREVSILLDEYWHIASQMFEDHNGHVEFGYSSGKIYTLLIYLILVTYIFLKELDFSR